MKSKINTLIKDTGVYGLGSVLTSMIGIILIPIYTRVFTPAEYGIVDVITTLTGILAITLIMGMESSQTFYFFDTKDPEKRKSIVTTVFLHRIIVSILLCSILIIFAETLALILFKETSNTLYIQLALVTVIFTVIKSQILDVQRITRKKFSYLGISFGFALLSAILTIYLVVICNLGLLGLYIALLASTIVFTIAGIGTIRRELSYHPSFKKMREMLLYGLPLLPSGLSIWMMNFADRYVLLQYVDLNDIGLYALAIKAGLAVGFIGMAFRLSWNPIAFSAKDEPDGPRFYATVFKWYFLILCIIGTFVSLFSYEAFVLFTTPAYYDAYIYVAPVVFAQCAWNLLPILALGCFFMKKTKINLLAFGLAAILNVVLNLIFVPYYGVIASALTTLFSFTIAIIIFIHFSQKYYYIPFEWHGAIKLCILTAACILIGYILGVDKSWFSSLAKMGLFTSYMLSLIFLSIVSRNEILQIKNYVNDIKKTYLAK